MTVIDALGLGIIGYQIVTITLVIVFGVEKKRL